MRGVYIGGLTTVYNSKKYPFYRLQNLKIGFSSIQSIFGFYELCKLTIVSSKKNIKILAKDGRFPGKDGVYIDNVVYPEILT